MSWYECELSLACSHIWTPFSHQGVLCLRRLWDSWELKSFWRKRLGWISRVLSPVMGTKGRSSIWHRQRRLPSAGADPDASLPLSTSCFLLSVFHDVLTFQLLFLFLFSISLLKSNFLPTQPLCFLVGGIHQLPHAHVSTEPSTAMPRLPRWIVPLKPWARIHPCSLQLLLPDVLLQPWEKELIWTNLQNRDTFP